MTADIIQFIPRPRHDRETDFPTIVFKVPVALYNAHERELYDFAPSEYVAPDKDPA